MLGDLIFSSSAASLRKGCNCVPPPGKNFLGGKLGRMLSSTPQSGGDLYKHEVLWRGSHLNDGVAAELQLYRPVYGEVCVCGQRMRGDLEIDFVDRQKRKGELTTGFKGCVLLILKGMLPLFKSHTTVFI